MSKIASKLSRQIMAAVLSVAMILPNMTVYASEVSVPETQEEITVDNDELNEEQPSLTNEAPKSDEGGEETLPEDDEADGVSNDGGEDSDDGGLSEEPEKSEESDVSEPSNTVSEDEGPDLNVVEPKVAPEGSRDISIELSGVKGLTNHKLSGLELKITKDGESEATTYYVGDEIALEGEIFEEDGITIKDEAITLAEAITLPDGNYSVELANQSYAQTLMPALDGAESDGKLSLIVGESAENKIKITCTKDDTKKDVTKWTLRNSEFVKGLGQTNADAISGWYQGLKLDKVFNNGNYLYVANGGSVKIPVSKKSAVTVTYYKEMTTGTIGDVAFTDKGSSTYLYEEDKEGYVTISSTGSIDIDTITVTGLVTVPSTFVFNKSFYPNETPITSTDIEGITFPSSGNFRQDQDYNIGNGTILIYVPGNCDITVAGYYKSAATIGVEDDDSDKRKSFTLGAADNNTNSDDPVTYEYRGGKAATVTIESKGDTYITLIKITAPPAVVNIPSIFDFTIADKNSEGQDNAGYIPSFDDCEGITATDNVNRRTTSNGGGQFDVLMPASSSIDINVPGNCDITVTSNWKADATIGVGEDDKTATELKLASGNGTNPVTYKYRGGKSGTVTINAKGETYVNKIEITAAPETVDIPTIWEFQDSSSENAVTDLNNCKGLTVKGATLTAGNSLNFSGNDEIYITVDKPCDIKVDCYYTANMTIGVDTDTKGISIAKGEDPKSATYEYRGNKEAIVTIKSNGSNRTYISTITITEASADEPGEETDEDGFVNGLTASTVSAEKSYYYNFTAQADADVVLAEPYTKGLFSYEKPEGSSLATYHSTQHGIEFKAGNKLKFKVAGNSYIVVGGNPNSSETKLTATSETGTFKPEYHIARTPGGQAELEDCKTTEGQYTLVYEYTGSAGEVTLTPETDKVYMAYVCVIPIEPTIAEGTYPLGSKTEAYVTTEIPGLSVSGTFAYGNDHGIQTKAAGAKVILNLADTATIEVTTCRYGSGASNTTTMTSSSGGDVKETSVDEGGAPAPVFTVKGASGKTELTFSNDTYIHSIGVFYTPDVEKPDFNGKPDVWDFGAEAIAGANNNLTVDIINGFYGEGVTPGSENKEIGSFTAKDSYNLDAVRFVSDKTNNRIRTTNAAITRYDSKSKTDKDGKTYTGYVYSNNSSTSATRLEVYLFEGDTLKCMLGANDGEATYILTNPNDEEYDKFTYTKEYGVEEAVFHAAEAGWYKLYCEDEKLVCARITREHAPIIAVSGDINTDAAPELPADYGILYTNDTTGLVTEATRDDATYSVELYGGYTYTASVKDIDTYVVKDGRKLTLADEETKTNNLSIEKVPLNTITGTISGLPTDQIKKLKFDFEIPDGYVYKPRAEINDDATYTMSVETGVIYNLTAKNVNDYTLNTTTISASEDSVDVEITFTKKATYAVTLNITGVDDPSKAVATFTNIDEDGYVYTFNNLADIQLRNGRYSVKVTGLDNYPVVQGLTKNVNVNGEAITSAEVPFKRISSWDFAGMIADGKNIATIDGKKYFLGLELSASGAALNNKKYLLVNSGATVKIPSLEAGDKVTLKYCYEAAFKVNNTTVDEYSGSTDQIDSKVIDITADGDLTITGVNSETEGRQNRTFFCGIEVLKASDIVAYTETLNVGTDKAYKTINAALDDVRKMTRDDGQVVTIMIDPGDYEEMLVIDVPDLVLKNASATPSIKLKNKGVDRDVNAVRVTWYYGHGYTYYSMGPDSKYDAELLEVNKANGYASFKNPGAGSTAESYWNASVTVKANNFSAEGIIFENSFNQYVSAKSVEDVIEAQRNGAKEGTVARATMKTVGDTKVQEKEYVERAAALAIYNNVSKAYFKNCMFVSRQDTLYGGVGTTAAFEDCAVYGGTDYIFGGMTAVFKKCDLVFNTNDQTDKGAKDDVGYITAPQQKSGRGYLMYECRVTSTQPGEDTASIHTSKPGYLGRPWEANTSEAVFYKTTIDEADSYWHDDYGKSLIRSAGWLNTLSGESAKCGEYGTVESASDIDNSTKRAGWSGEVFTDGKLADGTAITIEAFLGTWNPFAAGEDSVQLTTPPEAPTANPQSGSQVRSGTEVSLSADDGVAIYYTTGKTEDIEDPFMSAEGTALYEAPIEINSDTLVIKAFTVKNYVTSEVKTFVYTLKGSGNQENPDEDDSGLTVVLDPEKIPEDGYVYTGSAITPAVIVKNNNIPLTEGVDYTVKYSNNKNANAGKDEKKQAKITVTGKGSFSGSAFTYFTINPKSLAEDEDDENPVIAGSIKVVKNKKVAPILFYNGVKLTAKDFIIDGDSKFADAGDKSVKIKAGKSGNFTGERVIPVTVVDSAAGLDKITSVVLTPGTTYVYDGTEKEPKFTVKSGQNEVKNSEGVEDNYTVVYNRNIIDAGTVKFTVIGLGGYTGSVTKSYKIAPNKSADITATLAETSYEYVSSGVTVPDEDLTVKVGDTPLTNGVDYKVTYSGNKKVTNGATAKCNVTFIGNYKGCAKKPLTFAITTATISDETVDVVSADKVFKKPGLYKSAPVVISKADGSQLKASDYTVKYYLDDAFATEMKGKDKVTAAGAKVYVKVTGKGNYANASDTVYAKGEYTVCALPDGVQDLSTAKIEFYVNGSDKKTTKIEYTGKPIKFNDGEDGETPQYELRVMIGKGKNATKVSEDKYEITYANNINKGKATVVITPAEGTTEYVGGKTATFNIVAQKVKTDLLGGLFGGAAPDLSNLIESILTNE